MSVPLTQPGSPPRDRRKPAPPRQAHRSVPDRDIARAHQQAQDITRQWLEADWHPALTERWQDRHRRLAAAIPGPEAALADVITHPEILAVARLLIRSQRTPGIPPRDIARRLGFPYPSHPHPLDPLRIATIAG